MSAPVSTTWPFISNSQKMISAFTPPSKRFTTKIGTLPPHLAAMMQTNINVQSMTVEAALTGKREHVYHAAAFDPHTAAELSLDHIWNLCDDLIAAHGDMMPTLK